MLSRMDARQQILDELDTIAAAVENLRGSEMAAKKQTDLEIAILKKKQGAARENISGALAILKALA